MSNIIKKIAARAKQIRKAHPNMKWQSCIKQASRELKGSKPGSTAKKSGTKRKKSASRQTGTSATRADKKRTAKSPGKRMSRSKKVYYERRKNRSDKPGSLSGVKKPFTIAVLKKRYPREMMGWREREVLLHGSKIKLKCIQPGVYEVSSSKGAFQFVFMFKGYKDFTVVG